MDRLELRDFQSIRAANVRLGGVTVITGPTGSGKSALFRAAWLLARNGRGVDRYLRAGSKSLSVAALGDNWAVRLTRSGSRGKNEYVLARSGEGGWGTDTYTKLAGAVPDDVAAVLRLSELNFARQGEPAFLLDVPGTEVARRLGALTNVSLVLGAAQEAGRLRKRYQHDLEAAQERREALLREAQEFASLNVQRAAIGVAEAVLERAQASAARVTRLEGLIASLELAERAHAQALQVAALHEPPSMERLEQLAAQCARLDAAASALWAQLEGVAQLESEARSAAAAEEEAARQLHAALAEAGECPTCGQAVS